MDLSARPVPCAVMEAANLLCLPSHLRLNKEQIRAILPHEDDALVLDSAIVKFRERRGEGSFLIGDENSHTMRGHFRGQPIFPGHWSLEVACLTAAVTAAVLRNVNFQVRKVMVTRHEGKLEWPGSAFPGEQLNCVTQVLMLNSRAITFSAFIQKGGGQTILRAEKFLGVFA